MDLNFKTFGEGEPLIILHGLFGTSDNWQTIGKRLADHYMVYLVDQRNHGRSPHEPEMDYPHLADDLRQFMQSQWIHRAHIMGHSMGGKTAMEFALHNPDMTDKLIVVDIAPKTYPPGHELILNALNSLNPSTITDRKEAEEALAVYIDDPGIRLFLLKNLARKKSGGFQWKMNLEAITRHYHRILEKPSPAEPFFGEALFIRGGRSDYVTDEDLDAIKTRFPHARMATIKEAGHWVHADDPNGLYALVSEFLDH